MKKLTEYFFQLTKRNWGAPYHYILTTWLIGAQMVVGISWHASSIITFFIAGGYEIYQMAMNDETPKGALEDMLFVVAAIATMVLL